MTDRSEKPQLENPVKIIPPHNFPVDWEDEADADLLWSWDNFHTPVPSSPMTTTVGNIVGYGVDAANRAFGRESTRGRRKIFNGYPYSPIIPPDDSDEDKHKELLADAIGKLEHRWLTEFLPELERDLAEFKAVDLQSLSDADFQAHLDRLFKRYSRHWEIHFYVVFPVHASVDRLKETYEALVGEGTGEDVYSLIDAAETKTMEVSRALDALGDKARDLSEVADILKQSLDANETISRLRDSNHGLEWLVAYEQFMDQYGYRPSGFDLRFKTWREDPEFVLVNVRGHLAGQRTSGSTESSDLEQTIIMSQVEAALKEQPEKREEFETRLAQAREIWHLKEDHGFYIDQASFAIVRIAIAELGRRLARDGVVADREDVFYLEMDEAREALNNSQTKHGIVDERKSNIERWSKLSPPRYLGTVPAENPPDAAVEQIMAAERVTSDELAGEGASSGSASGPARIVVSPDQFHKVQQGDVLVCRSTAPSWTPLFSIVSALISEAGGVLSHPAIIAREHRLPAVVGVPGATELLSDGQLVEVNGESGSIRLLSQ